MLLFDGLVYLDVQKTGSTFVTAFLQACCRRPQVHYHQHDRLRRKLAPGAVGVISVREPASQYLSLFRYGLDGKGGLYHRLKDHGVAEVYQPTQEAFETFVEILLQPETAPLLHDSFEPVARKFDMGMMTFRHLLLSLKWPLATLKRLPRDGLPTAYPRLRLWSEALRQEHLVADLQTLVARHPDLFDLEAAQAFLAPRPRINRSDRGAGLSTDLPAPLMARLLQREDLIYRTFYPHLLPEGQADLTV
ncbi:hypothetical protein E4L95_07310 [Paracoccus liaowanqingii]|uniref:Sulfotransferase family protein n=1 Tax=Paracoccus liaowanqingii TaxID=2560053 RepID=A0A4Z1BXH6_9RHOB|nr:hypothetical protein [Paracoccus liaowanqingii]TGN62286.1 hypothetical protein E4L95_07310 [Paracoccus liaowanqingii]